MVTSQGNALRYVSTGGFIDVPTADDVLYRKAHPPQKPKPSGLDWGALTPTCNACHTRSGTVDATGECATCRTTPEPDVETDDVATTNGADTYVTLDDADLAAKFTPTTRLPEADNQGKPAPGPSAPGKPSSSRTTRKARKAGPATLPPAATRDTRPAVAAGTPSQNLDAQCAHATRVLRDTATSTNPAIVMARAATLAALEALHLIHELYNHTTETPQGEDAPATPAAGAHHQPPAPRPAAPTKKPKPKAKAKPQAKPTERRPRNGRTFPLAQARSLYLNDKLTCPEIGQRVGFSTVVVRRHLKAAGTPMRDDRAGHSGGRNKIIRDPDTLVADVRRLYLDQGLSIAQVAKTLDHGHNAIAGLMRRNGIPTRPGNHVPGSRPGTDRAADLKALIASLDVPTRDIKTWALKQGLVTQINRGLPSRAVVDAYAAAHQPTA